MVFSCHPSRRLQVCSRGRCEHVNVNFVATAKFSSDSDFISLVLKLLGHFSGGAQGAREAATVLPASLMIQHSGIYTLTWT